VYSLPVGIGTYQCPLYYYPQRGGCERHSTSFVTCLDFKSADHKPSEHWIRRATAALLSLAD